MKPARTLLVTGFGPFPGAPVNPTAHLIRRLPVILGKTIGSVSLEYAVLPATWSGRQAVTRTLIDRVAPDAVVHFGVDGKRREINIETRAVNRAIRVRCDAEGAYSATACLGHPAEAPRLSTLSPARLLEAVRRTGAPVAMSKDAGNYLCNATLWDTLGRGLPAVFVHVPSLPRGRSEDRPPYRTVERAAVSLLKEAARLTAYRTSSGGTVVRSGPAVGEEGPCLNAARAKSAV
ncbi:peptidase C15 [Roseibium sp. RKSG952]|uniref:pyroglutamyl-peptidase I family protein n=1 Tax=Roseibium sp. RKSG952 TaxID=2529384 RepID=UPI0012BC7D25|nr:peptidase C15 [Roseibium sp. RKSG952]MTH97979.1 peptidase C15 [Roseibium sp. RKSG952]